MNVSEQIKDLLLQQSSFSSKMGEYCLKKVHFALLFRVFGHSRILFSWIMARRTSQRLIKLKTSHFHVQVYNLYFNARDDEVFPMTVAAYDISYAYCDGGGYYQ